MKHFTLALNSAVQVQNFDDVTAFVGEDESGSFAIRADHERMMTALGIGLARFQRAECWHYLALPGAMLWFHENQLTICTRHYLLDDDIDHISSALEEQLLTEEASLHGIRDSLRQMEDELMKRLLQLDRTTTASRL